MNTVLYKALYIVAGVLIVAVVLMFGIKQYGNARVAAQELSTVKETVQEAVTAREDAVLVDVSQMKENAAAARKVRSVLIKVRKEIKDVPSPCVDAVGDVERIRLLNLAISETNRVIATSGELPE